MCHQSLTQHCLHTKLFFNVYNPLTKLAILSIIKFGVPFVVYLEEYLKISDFEFSL